MKIIKLQAENIKRLVAVEITPDENIVEITGKNAAGKTSVLDSIWWALTGASHIQAVPIRRGTNKARIRLDLGEIIVTRVFNKSKAGNATTSITVESADGKKMASPQTILNDLIGELSFDPLAFSRMTGAEQLNALRRFVPDVDFEAITAANHADYFKRTEINRQAKRARAAADGIVIAEGTPDSLIDESALVDALEKAAEQNVKLEQRKARREEAGRDVDNKTAEAFRIGERADQKKKEAEGLMDESKSLERSAAIVTEAVFSLKKKLADAEPLPEPIDTADLREKIKKAQFTNINVGHAAEKTAQLRNAREFKEKAATLTHSMEIRESEKRSAIEKAEMPVKEITLGDGEVLLNGVPFDQASDAERLRVSVSIAMAANPKLHVIRVRDGSLLDEDSMRLLAEMADTNDYQIWIERVGEGKTGIIIEDGAVKREEPIEKELLTPDFGGREV